jgi:hypothetical protein
MARLPTHGKTANAWQDCQRMARLSTKGKTANEGQDCQRRARLPTKRKAANETQGCQRNARLPTQDKAANAGQGCQRNARLPRFSSCNLEDAQLKRNVLRPKIEDLRTKALSLNFQRPIADAERRPPRAWLSLHPQAGTWGGVRAVVSERISDRQRVGGLRRSGAFAIAGNALFEVIYGIYANLRGFFWVSAVIYRSPTGHLRHSPAAQRSSHFEKCNCVVIFGKACHLRRRQLSSSCHLLRFRMFCGDGPCAAQSASGHPAGRGDGSLHHGYAYHSSPHHPLPTAHFPLATSCHYGR